MEGIAAASSILQVISSVTKLAKELNEVRQSYNNVALNTAIVASRLATIRAALEALHDWRSNDREITDHSQQLDKDLEVSLGCCAILIAVIDGKLGESGYKPGIKQKIRYIWLEDILKDYLSNLEGQVQALQLLFTIYQCKTATEQRQKLERAESRRIIENVRAETQSLSTGNKDFQDAASVLSLDPSIHFDFDTILMKTPIYMSAYGKRGARRDPPPIPDRALKPPRLPSRAPPRNRKKTSVWNDYLGQEVDLGTASMEDSRGLEDQLDEQADAKTLEQFRTIGQEQKTISTIAEFSNEAGTVDVTECRPCNEAASPLARADDTMTPANSGLKAAFDSPTTAALDLTQRGDVISPSNIDESRSALSLLGTASSGLTQGGITIPSLTVSEPRLTLSLSGQAKSDMITSEGGVVLPSAVDGWKHIRKTKFESKSHLGNVKQTPSVFYGPNRITEASLVQNSDAEEDAPTLASSVSSPSGPKQESEPESEPEDFRKLSSRIILENKTKDVPLQHISAETNSATMSKVEASQSSSSNFDHEIIRSVNTATPGKETEVYKDFRPQDIASDNSQHVTPGSSGSLSDTSVSQRRVSTSSKTLVGGPKLEEADLDSRGNLDSSQYIGKSAESSHVTPLSGLEIAIPPAPESTKSEDRSMQLNTSLSADVGPGVPLPPQYPPPLPPRSSTVSSPSTLPPLTTTSALTGTDLYPVKPNIDLFTIDPASNASSSEFPEVNTADSIAPPLTIREQGQIELRNLQIQLAAAKARGDSQSQEDVIQRSIEVIRRTHLAPPAKISPIKTRPKLSSPQLKNRASRIFPSLTPSIKSDALGQAAASGNETALTQLLNDNFNVNCPGCDFKTPMMRAAINGQIRCLSILKTFRANEFAVDKKGATVLHHAVMSNNVPVVKWLLDAYSSQAVDVNKNRSSILSLATEAAKWGRSPRTLREASDATGSTPLHLAVTHDRGGMVQTLLASGADIEAKNNMGRTPLIQAVIAFRQDSFDTLLRSGAKIDTTDDARMSVLHWAAKTGQVAMVISLLEKGAGRWDYDNAGHQPIHEAAEAGHVPAVEALLAEATDLNMRTKSGESLLHIASLHGRLELARYLLKNGVDVNTWADRAPSWACNRQNSLLGSSLTPLHFACCYGHFEMASLLLDHEAFINAPTPDGYTPLMMAVQAESTDLVSLLHRRGANVNASLPGSLATALHMACRTGDLETVRELCRAGANFRLRAEKNTDYKRTPLELTCECGDGRKREAVRDYLRILNHNYSAKPGSHITQPYTQGAQPQQQRRSQFGQQVGNAPDAQEPAPPPYSKAPPTWR